MIPLAHYAASAPLGLATADLMIVTGVAPIPVALLCGGLVVHTSTWNDLDHPRHKGRMNPGAALVRGSGYLGYMIRTAKDIPRDDVHRGPSHCLEWCALAGLFFVVLTALIPPLAPWAWWWGAAVALGTASHVLGDWPTPSGVPLSAIYNYLRYREVWRRHTLNWFATDSGAERFRLVPVLFTLTAVMFLWMVGALGAVTGWLVGA